MAAATLREPLRIKCLDFASDSYDFRAYSHLQMLFRNLHNRHGKSAANFWEARSTIARDTRSLVIAVREDNEQEQVGFCVVVVEKNQRWCTVKLIESFVERRRVATQMLDHVATRYSESPGLRMRMFVDRPARRAESFWNFYAGSNPDTVGNILWRVDVDTGEGPYFKITRDLTVADFKEMLFDFILSIIGTVGILGNDEVGFFYQHSTNCQKVRVLFIGQPLFDEPLDHIVNAHEHLLFKASSFKTRIDVQHPRDFKTADLHAMQRSFSKYGVEVKFL